MSLSLPSNGIAWAVAPSGDIGIKMYLKQTTHHVPALIHIYKCEYIQSKWPCSM